MNLGNLNILPLGAAFFDLLENISIVMMLTAYPSFPVIVAWLGTVFTMSKTILLGASTLLIMVGVVGVALNSLKKR